MFVHTMGLILYYADSPKLCETVFLKPQWVANVVKTIIRHDLSMVSVT